MRSLPALVLTAAALLLAGAPAGAEEPTDREGIRQALVAAARAQPVFHAALEWTIRSEGRTRFVHTECFRSGDLAAVSIWGREGEAWTEQMLVATDGDVMLKREAGGEDVWHVGRKRLVAFAAPWRAARDAIAASLPAMPARAFSLALCMHVEDEDGAPDLDIGIFSGFLRSARQAPVEWLEGPYWDALISVKSASGEGPVRIRGEGFTAALDPTTGRALRWQASNPRTGGRATAEAVAPQRTAEAWRAHLHDVFVATPTAERARVVVPGSMTVELLELVTDDVIAALEGTDPEKEQIQRALRELAAPYALRRGPTGPLRLEDADAEHRRLEKECLRFGAVLTDRARRAGWDRELAFWLGLGARETCQALFERFGPR